MMTAKRPHVIIYTDGGCKPNPGPGGWGVLLLWGIDYAKELSGAEPHTTNNRMELTAAIEALRALKRPCDVTLHTDSEYLQQGITSWLPDWIARGWRRKGNRPVENEDLWRALHAETQRHTISWRWVKGHAGDAHNERVDQLATQARERLLQQIDSPASAAFDPDYEIALRISLPQVPATVYGSSPRSRRYATSPKARACACSLLIVIWSPESRGGSRDGAHMAGKQRVDRPSRTATHGKHWRRKPTSV